MNDQNRRISELAARMRVFGLANAPDFPPASIGGQRFGELNTLVTRFDELGSKQAQERGAAMAATEAKAALRIKIRRCMKVMRETAVSMEAQQPGISQNFNMPASNSDESLVEAARAFVAAATPLKPFFISREMPEAFLDELTSAIELFEAAVDDYNLHSGNSSTATELLDDVRSQVLQIRRELNAIVRNKYQNDREKLALWDTASYLERPPKRTAQERPTGAPASPSGAQG